MPSFSIDNEEFNAKIAVFAERQFSASALINANYLSSGETSIVDPSNFDLSIALNVITSMVNGERPKNEDLINFILAKSIRIDTTESLDLNVLTGLCHLIKNNNDSNLLAIYLLTLIIVDNKVDVSSDIIDVALDGIHSNINGETQSINLHLLKELVYSKSIRLAYLNKFGSEEIISIFISNISSLNLQMKYTLIFIIWSFSFNTKFSNLEISKLIPILFAVAKDGVKEKVIRLSISTLINLAKNESILKKYLLCNGVPILKSLSERKWSDDELKMDLDTLRVKLEESVTSLTTWDEYSDELRSGQFQWSPTHKSDEFWLDNNDKFKENGWKNVKDMVKLLEKNDTIDENQLYLNQAIVCFDLAKLINLLPEIIIILTKIGAKTKIMTLMNSPNPNVKYEALKTTQLLVSKSI